MKPTEIGKVAVMPDTLARLLAAQAAARGDAAAIVAPGRPALSYAALLRQAQAVSGVLRGAGVSCRDRVALVVAEGPEAAAAFLSVGSCAAAAPLNPLYRAQELAFCLEDLRARAVVVSAGLPTPVREVARSAGIALLELEPVRGGSAGAFTLRPSGVAAGAPAPATGPMPGPDDVALVLHTSGTTARPKQVPLTQRNLLASAANIVESLALGPGDRCLNIMPLFHIHGLVAAVLASLEAGGSVACTPGLRPGVFFSWLEELQPTWYTAVPTLHQAILAETASCGSVPAGRLRFVRSCSAALPPRTAAELEARLGVPAIEAYGMTEAAHQVASNPLPPGVRKPGSVGRAAGPEVAVMDAAGRLLPPGTTGEVVIRGANVMAGYAADPAANAGAFSGGWFRTGDQGRLDEDGYLFLTGRLKELINRGGEKISPREIDEVLLAHPAVAQAVAFALPHGSLGEEVAAAVVLRAGASVSERQLRELAAARLSYHKVPRRVVFVQAIPKGPTGKVQRIGLAEALGLGGVAAAPEEVSGAPAGALEEIVAAVWAELLGAPPGGRQQDFFRAGGDSLRAAALVSRLGEALRVELSLLAFFDDPTVAGVAAALSELLAAEEGAAAPGVPAP